MNSWNSGDEEGGLLADVDRVVADRSMQRETTIIRMPHSCVPGVLAIVEHLVGRPAVRAVDQLVELDEAAGPLDVAAENESRATRTISAARSPMSGQALDQVVVRLELARELRQLCDRDALVADPLEVDRVVEDREHEAESVATGDCWASSSSTDFSIPWYRSRSRRRRLRPRRRARRPATGERRPRRASARRTTDPCSCSVASSESRLRLELDAGHRHPNRPVT